MNIYEQRRGSKAEYLEVMEALGFNLKLDQWPSTALIGFLMFTHPTDDSKTVIYQAHSYFANLQRAAVTLQQIGRQTLKMEVE